MSPQAEALLDLLINGHPHRVVYRSRHGNSWFVTYHSGKVDVAIVRELFDAGHIVSVYSNCPTDSYHIGRTIDVERSMAARKKHGKGEPIIYCAPPASTWRRRRASVERKMIHIPSLIERLLSYQTSLRFEHLPPEIDLGQLLSKAAEALSLTASPLPEEIGKLTEGLWRLAAQTEFAPGWSADKTLHGKAAAALERMARENERLKAQIGDSQSLLDAAIAGLADNDRLHDRIRELEAERDEWKATSEAISMIWDKRIEEACAAIKAKTIAECVAAAEWFRNVNTWHWDDLIARIRALNQPPASGTE